MRLPHKHILTVFLALLLAACAQDAQIKNSTDSVTAATDSADACCSPETAGQATTEALSDSSIYHLGSRWTDQNGREFAIQELRGSLQVVAMVFTHCAYACPRLTADMQAIAEEFNSAQARDVRFTLFSMDPARDTPAALLHYAQEHELDLTRWTLLCAPAADVQELAAVLGVKYQQGANGDFSHSNLITVLDRSGVIRYRQEGLNVDPAAVLTHIHAQLN